MARDLAEPEEDEADDEGTLVRTAPLSRHFVSGASQVRQLIDQGAVTMFFQPIVTLPSARVAAYEALGRGRMPGLPESPVELFDVAGRWGPTPRPSSAGCSAARRWSWCATGPSRPCSS